MGRWKTQAVWRTEYAFSPGDVLVDVTDPQGSIREQRFRIGELTIERIVQQVLTFLEEASGCDGWQGYDLLQESKRLKKQVEKLTGQVKLLTAQLAEATARLETGQL